MRTTCCFAVLIAFTVGCARSSPSTAGPALPVANDYPAEALFAVKDVVEGKTMEEWTAEWWKWVIAIPKARNPLADKTGEFASEEQRGPVWFLVGTLSKAGPVERTCRVPSEKAILFPLVSFMDCCPPGAKDVRFLWHEVEKAMDRWVNPHELEARVNDRAIRNLTQYRCKPDEFRIRGPARRADEVISGTVGVQTAVADGWWVMLRPLTEGEHVLRFKAVIRENDPPERIDVTYKLTVGGDRK